MYSAHLPEAKKSNSLKSSSNDFNESTSTANATVTSAIAMTRKMALTMGSLMLLMVNLED